MYFAHQGSESDIKFNTNRKFKAFATRAERADCITKLYLSGENLIACPESLVIKHCGRRYTILDGEVIPEMYRLYLPEFDTDFIGTKREMLDRLALCLDVGRCKQITITRIED